MSKVINGVIAFALSLTIISTQFLGYTDNSYNKDNFVYAESEEFGSIKWSLNNGVLKITGSGGMQTSSLNIPWKDEIDNITTIEIDSGIINVGSFAFRNCQNLISVSLPDTITSIEKNAFKGCSLLAEINFPAGLKSIERSAFMDCSALKEVSFPNTLDSIGESAFEGCSSLSKAIIPDSVSVIEDYAFENTNSDFLICCSFGSAAYSYAKANGIKYDDSYTFEIDKENDTENDSDPDDTYSIRSTDDLAQLPSVIKKYKTISLKTDIVAPEKWTSISELNGTFNGNGHSISGLTDCLFTTIEKDAVINNLTLSDVQINETTGGSPLGAIASENKGVIKNCKVTGAVNYKATLRMESKITWLDTAVFPATFKYFCAGSIVGINSGQIIGCTNDAKVNVSNSSDIEKDHSIYYASAGGIVGENTGEIRNCVNCGDAYSMISSYTVMDYDSDRTREGYTVAISGGITGFNKGTITGCKSAGVHATNYNKSGGVYTDSTTKDEEASYDNEPAMYAYAGGIAGATTGSISQCSVSDLGKQITSLSTMMFVTAPKYTPYYDLREVNMWCGGIAGAAFGNATIDQCSNRLNPRAAFEVNGVLGQMNEHVFCGGILGAAYYQNPKITNCYNWGKPTITDEFTAAEQVTKISGGFMHGGIVGGIYNSIFVANKTIESYKGSATISNCYSIAPASRFIDSFNDIYDYALINENTTLSNVTDNATLTNCYYIDTLDGQYGTKKSEAEMKSEEFAEQLGDAFVYEADSFPMLSWEKQKIKGDVNADGYLTVADVVLLQKWLLAVPDIKLPDWKAADLIDDDRLDVFDLVLMKRELINNM